MIEYSVDILVYTYKGIKDDLSSFKNIGIYSAIYSVNSSIEYLFALNIQKELSSDDKVLFHGECIDEGFISSINSEYLLECVIINPADSILLHRNETFDSSKFKGKSFSKVTDPVSRFFIRNFPSLVTNYFDSIADQASSVLNKFDKVYKYDELLQKEVTVADYNFRLGNDFEADYRIYYNTYLDENIRIQNSQLSPIYYYGLLVEFLRLKEHSFRVEIIDSISSNFLKSILSLHINKSNIERELIYDGLEKYVGDHISDEEILNIIYFLEQMYEKKKEGNQGNIDSKNWPIQYSSFLMMSSPSQLDAIENMDPLLYEHNTYKLLITKARYKLNRKKDCITAEKHLLQALKIEPLNPSAYKLLIKLYKNTNNYYNLIKSYEKCLELLPSNKKLTLKYIEEYHSELK